MEEISELRKTVSANLKFFRKTNSLTQNRLSEISKVSVQTITSIENAKSFPQEETLEALAKVLGVRPIDFFSQSENPYQKLAMDMESFKSVINDIQNSVSIFSQVKLPSGFDNSHLKK